MIGHEHVIVWPDREQYQNDSRFTLSSRHLDHVSVVRVETDPSQASGDRSLKEPQQERSLISVEEAEHLFHKFASDPYLD